MVVVAHIHSRRYIISGTYHSYNINISTLCIMPAYNVTGRGAGDVFVDMHNIYNIHPCHITTLYKCVIKYKMVRPLIIMLWSF